MGGTATMEPDSAGVQLSLTSDVQYVVGPVSSVTEVANALLAEFRFRLFKKRRREWLVLWIRRTQCRGNLQFLQVSTNEMGNLGERITTAGLGSGDYPFASGSEMASFRRLGHPTMGKHCSWGR